MTHATMKKFGHPASLIRDYDNWCVLLRPAQATLGALVLVCKDDAEAFSDIPAQGFAELATVIADIETGLKAFRSYDKINYLMLMMVDKQVHFHVLPRYGESQSFAGVTVEDAGWPAVPDLSKAAALSETQMAGLLDELKSVWPGG
jgi:diadenosine tetraphosphate (Ap4A) HIT family hydrolase